MFARNTQVELCGRSINVGRPKGYMDPALLGGMGVQMPAMPAMPAMGLSTPNMFPNMPHKQMQMPGMGMQMPGMGIAGGGVNQQQMLLGMVREIDPLYPRTRSLLSLSSEREGGGDGPRVTFTSETSRNRASNRLPPWRGQ